MDSRLLRASELGIRLEFVAGLPIWEASPVMRHQVAIDRIRRSIRPNKNQDVCQCIHVADVYVQFLDGSLKRPDISIFCREPDEQEEAVKLLPEAVIEVTSKGYEKKDLEIGVPFYLSQGVKDIVVFDPFDNKVLHFRADQSRSFESPGEIEFLCGCQCTV